MNKPEISTEGKEIQMVEIWLPYGETEVCLTIAAENLLGTIEPQPRDTVANPEEALESALENPIGSPRLREIVAREGSVALAVDATSNSSLNQLMLSKILKELKSGGIPDSEITIIFGQGSQPPPDRSLPPSGEGDLGGLLAITHDPNTSELKEVGVTSRKTHVMLNRAFAEADFKVLIGEIGLDTSAGYSGGRMGVLSLGGSKTIQHNRNLTTDPNCRAGNLEKNPVHLDLTEMAELAKIDFMLNILTDGAGRLVKVFAGGLEPAFLEGVRFFDEAFGVRVGEKADIVVVSPGGHPCDEDFYHAIPSLMHVLEVVREGGVVVLVAECPQGHGNTAFYRWMNILRSFEEARETMKKSFTPELYAAYLLMKAQQKARIVTLSTMPDCITTGVFRLKGAECTEDSLETAYRLAGRKSKVWAVPRGHITLPILQATQPLRTTPG